MLNNITILPGEKRELVFLNDPNMEWHILQEKGSEVRVHILYLSKEEADAQWHSSLTIEQNGEGCRTEI